MRRAEHKMSYVLTLHLLILLSAQCLMTMAHAEDGTKLYIIYMGERRHENPKLVKKSHVDLLASVVGGKKAASESLVYSYKHGFSGFAAKLTSAQAQHLAGKPGVIRVSANRVFKKHTTRSWDFLDLPLQSLSTNLLQQANMGKDIIIGVIDSGIWPESKSFNDDGLGPIPSRWKGNCDAGDGFNASSCNKKLIGARWFADGAMTHLKAASLRDALHPNEPASARDAFGHGTHVASTAAGAVVPDVGFELGDGRAIGTGTARGGAPGARLAMYKVCWTSKIESHECTEADQLKAVDKAIHDGVDIISMSIGCKPPDDMEVDHLNLRFGSPYDGIHFHAAAKGIVFVVSAGNEGPSSYSIDHSAPWYLTVGASTIDRSFRTTITLGNNQTLQGLGVVVKKDDGPLDLFMVDDDCGSLMPSDGQPANASIKGKIVACFYGSGSTKMLDIINAVMSASALGLIVFRNPTAEIHAPTAAYFTTIEMDIESGIKIYKYSINNKTPTISISPTTTSVGDAGASNIVYSFSSRGPSPYSPEILKPDIVAPGVNILAAKEDEYTLKSGTSMAAPHIAGIVALLKAIHPNWSPAAIKSALTTTASYKDEYGYPILASPSSRKIADPFDMGGGIVNPNKAADPGLVYDMDISDYIYYMCAYGDDDTSISTVVNQTITCPQNPKASLLNVNVPSITIANLNGSVAIPRKVTNVGSPNNKNGTDTGETVYQVEIEPPMGTKVTVEPNVLKFKSINEIANFTVNFSAERPMVSRSYRFGSLTWKDGVHAVRIPLSVKINSL